MPPPKTKPAPRRKAPPVELGRLDRLVALRDRLTALIGDADTNATAVAALAGRLVVVLEQIEVLEREKPARSKVDELAQRRKSRRADAASGVPAAAADDRRARGTRAR